MIMILVLLWMCCCCFWHSLSSLYNILFSIVVFESFWMFSLVNFNLYSSLSVITVTFPLSADNIKQRLMKTKKRGQFLCSEFKVPVYSMLLQVGSVSSSME